MFKNPFRRQEYVSPFPEKMTKDKIPEIVSKLSELHHHDLPKKLQDNFSAKDPIYLVLKADSYAPDPDTSQETYLVAGKMDVLEAMSAVSEDANVDNVVDMTIGWLKANKKLGIFIDRELEYQDMSINVPR
jgi:hypothetical protein